MQSKREMSLSLRKYLDMKTRGTALRNAISALGARLTRVLSRDGASISSSDVVSVKALAGGDSYHGEHCTIRASGGKPLLSTASTMAHSSRSHSRGRELYSTGRGGAGNIHRSLSRDGSGPAIDPAPHGRESKPSGEPVTHVGRGGAGNFRDPSRPREEGITPAQASYEHDVIERHDESPHFYSTGRGGAGNIKTPTPEHSHSHSRSRSRGGPSSALDHPAQTPGMERSLSRGRVLHSTGRGGAGNITADTLHEEDADELERRAHSPSRAGGLHSTGRGGLANVTALSSPPIEVSPSRFGGGDGYGDGDGDGTGMVSTGRGGAGNIAPASRDRTRSASRGGAPRSGSRGRGERDAQAAQQHHHGAIGKIVERVKARHHEHHEHSEHGEEYYEKEGHEVPEAGVESPPAALK